MQIQLDPNIPTDLSVEDMRDFKTFLDTALESLTVAAGGELFTLGNQMFGGVKGGVNLDHFGGAKVDQLVKG